MRNPEDTLLDSWQHNAQAWIDAVRSGAIESRRQVTDQAILLAILGRQPERVLDLGCGEGWLLRALGDRGVEAVGVDGDRALVDAARAAGSAEVHLASWLNALDMAGLRLVSLQEPQHPQSAVPQSLLMVAERH